jgi:hypothetical protein
MHLINALGGGEIPWEVQLQVKDNMNVDVIKADWMSDGLDWLSIVSSSRCI